MNKILLIALALSFPLSGYTDSSPFDLLDVYQQAKVSDPAWAAAQNAHLATQEKLAQGRALTLPSATLRANVAHNQTDLDRVSAGSIAISRSGFDKFETYGYSVNITHPLYRKQNSIQYEMAEIQVAQAAEMLAQAHLDLMLRVSEAYFSVLVAQDRIDLIQAQKVVITKQLEQAQVNFEVGTATITDVYEAKARYDLILAQEIAAVNELEARRHAVQALIGKIPQRLAPAAETMPVAMPEPHSMEQWVELAQRHSPLVKIRQHELQLAGLEVERAHADHLPTLDIVGNFSDNRATGGISKEAAGYNKSLKTGVIGLQFELPLYRGGAITSRERAAAANKLKAMDNVELARRQAALQTRQAWLKLSSNVAQVKAFEQALLSSQSQLDATVLGYEVGVRTSIDVLNAQQQYYSAKRDLLQARYDYLLNLIRLKAAAGTLSDADLATINRLLASA